MEKSQCQPRPPCQLWSLSHHTGLPAGLMLCCHCPEIPHHFQQAPQSHSALGPRLCSWSWGHVWFKMGNWQELLCGMICWEFLRWFYFALSCQQNYIVFSGLICKPIRGFFLFPVLSPSHLPLCHLIQWLPGWGRKTKLTKAVSEL